MSRNIYDEVANAVEIIVNKKDQEEKYEFIENDDIRTSLMAFHVIIKSIIENNPRCYGKRICDNGTRCIYFKVYSFLRIMTSFILSENRDALDTDFVKSLHNTVGCTFHHDSSTTFDYQNHYEDAEIIFQVFKERYISVLNVLNILCHNVLLFNEFVGDVFTVQSFFENVKDVAIVEHTEVKRNRDDERFNINILKESGLSVEETKKIGKEDLVEW